MELRGARVAVTGATGFLGRYIALALRRRGAHAVGVVRDPARGRELAAQGVELRRADLSNPEALARAFGGCDAVVSNAALLSLTRFRPRDYVETNVRGTANVVESAAAAGVKRLVHVSSVGVYRGRQQPAVDETHPRYPRSTKLRRTNAYPVSKALAEETARELSRRHAIELTTIRPSGIYGAFDRNFMRVFKALVGFPITVYPAFFRLPLVYAGDVAEAIALCLENPIAVGKAYNVAGEDRSAWEFARAWRKAGGKSAWLMLPIPFPYRRVYDSRRAQAELGWRNRSYVEGLRETLAREDEALRH